jgi:hypothetical protein
MTPWVLAWPGSDHHLSLVSKPRRRTNTINYKFKFKVKLRVWVGADCFGDNPKPSFARKSWSVHSLCFTADHSGRLALIEQIELIDLVWAFDWVLFQLLVHVVVRVFDSSIVCTFVTGWRARIVGSGGHNTFTDPSSVRTQAGIESIKVIFILFQTNDANQH